MRDIRIAFVMATALAASLRADSPPDPVATVGGRPISRRALDDAVRNALNAQYFHGNVSAERLRALQQQELAGLIRRKLDLVGALDRGMPIPLSEARNECALMERTLGPKVYEASLKRLGWSREEHARALAETFLAARAYRRHVEEDARVSPQEVRTAFESNRARFTVPEQIHAEHILLRVPPGDAAAWTAREKEARALIARIRAGEPFGDVAAKSSDDAYRVKGGDLGWVHRGRLVAPLEEAAWRARPGDLVGPLRGPDGIHILRVLDRRGAHRMSFDEAAPTLRKEMEKARLNKAEERWYGGLRARHPVVILDPALAKMPR